MNPALVDCIAKTHVYVLLPETKTTEVEIRSLLVIWTFNCSANNGEIMVVEALQAVRAMHERL